MDCPGHASLIRTIIGGAQIIDMVLLVVDAYKGWQAQTTECLVLALLTSRRMVVVLNKLDMFPMEEMESRLEQAKQLVRQRLQSTRFRDASMVGVAACVGGEKVAAITAGASGATDTSTTTTTTTDTFFQAHHESRNIDQLLQVIQQELPIPQRSSVGPFSFSIDHCFPIRGRGTVLTGTVLNGSASINDMVEFPALGLERKVRSST